MRLYELWHALLDAIWTVIFTRKSVPIKRLKSTSGLCQIRILIHITHVRHTAFVMDLSLVSNDATCDSTLTLTLAGAADVVTEVHFKKRLDCHIFLINYIVPNSSMLAHFPITVTCLFIHPVSKVPAMNQPL